MAAISLCKIEGCGKVLSARGLCATHYAQQFRSGTCSVAGCGKFGKLTKGLCSKHYRRMKVYGDVSYVMPKALRKKNGPKGPRKFLIDENWLRNEYITKRRRNQDLCDEIGCSISTLFNNLKRYGIDARDDRAGSIHKGRRSKFNLSEAARLYINDLMNCNDIGARFGCSGDVIRRRLRESGVKIRHHNDTKRGRTSPHLIKLDAALVAKAYSDESATVKDVALKFGVNTSIIRRTLIEAGVEIKFKNRVGERNPRWRHDLTAEERATRRDMFKQAKWRTVVYERDGFECQRCGDDRGHNLNAHHIEAHCENKKDRFNPENGITLCVTCHRGFHRKYGLRGFGRKELAEHLVSYRKSVAA